MAEKKQYEQKEGLCLQAKFINTFTPEGDNTTYYMYGIVIKQDTGDVISKGVSGDMGVYYSTTMEQEFFKEGEVVKYLYNRNDEEPKNSRIKPFIEKGVQTPSQAQNAPNKAKNTLKSNLDRIDEYVMFKKADAISFSASYAKDLMVAGDKRKFEDIAGEILLWQLEKFELIK